MSRTMLGCSLRMIGFATILAAPMAWAQEAPPVRLRGTIERIDGAVYVVKARDGNELKVTLSEKPQIAGIVKASLSDIKQGSFVGVTATAEHGVSAARAVQSIWPRETTMKLPVKTIGAVLLTASLASVSLTKPAEARWRGWGWGGLGLGLAAGALIGARAYGYGYGYSYPAYSYGYGYPAYSYGYGYPASYGYSYPAYRAAYAYPNWGYGYYPRRAYGAYAFAPGYRLRRDWR